MKAKHAKSIIIFVLLISIISSAFAYETMRPGEKNRYITNLQLALNYLGYGLKADGKYGSLTEQAVRAFQYDKKLKTDGIAGNQTLALLFSLAPQFDIRSNLIASGAAPEGKRIASAGTIKGTLRPGDNASAVSVLQKRLIELGYPISKADSVYGKSTKQAVKLFQELNGMKADGVAGSATIRKLFSSDAVRYTPRATETPKPNAPAQTPPPANNNVPPAPPIKGKYRRGENASAIGKIQERLIALGYPIPRADSVFGKTTEHAVKLFQSENGLVVDGVVGSGTIRILFSPNAKRYGQAPGTTVPPQGNNTNPPADTKQGIAVVDTGRKSKLNFRSSANSKKHNIIGSLPNGTLVEVVQKGKTWTQIVFAGKGGYVMTKFLNFNPVNNITPTPAPTLPPASSAPSQEPTPSIPNVVLHEGMKGQEVTKMQKRLLELEYPVSINGIYDAKTKAAVISFQAQNGLSADGICGAHTFAVLYSPAAKKHAGDNNTANPGNAGSTTNEKPGGRPSLKHWYKEVKPSISSGRRLTVYHPASGKSFVLRAYSLGRHLDAEPLTLNDTLAMNAAFGPPSWNINVVNVKLPSGEWTVATMHNFPHLSGAIKDNGFDGHLCVHFLRDMEEAQKHDPNYGVNNQKKIRDAWKRISGETLDY